MRPDERAPIPLPSPDPLLPPEGFSTRLSALGVVLSPPSIAKLGDYLARLLAMNELMNLTAVADPAAVWERHGLDALSVVPHLAELREGARLIDIGSGGGLPGIPIAIARPDLHVTLVEATQKKSAFLVAVSAALGLSRVVVRAERAEQLAAGELRFAFDVVTARAVARLSKLLPLTAPFVRAGGLLLLVKGERADEELTEAAGVLRRLRVVHEKTMATPTGRIVVLRRAG